LPDPGIGNMVDGRPDMQILAYRSPIKPKPRLCALSATGTASVRAHRINPYPGCIWDGYGL